MSASGFVSSSTRPSWRIAAIVASSCAGSSPGWRRNSAGAWHETMAATICPMKSLGALSAAALLHVCRDRTVVIPRGRIFREELFVFHPTMGLLEHLARIRLKHQTFSRPKPADIDHPMILLGQLFKEIVLVALRLQVDVALCALQCPEVAFDIFHIRIRMQQKADHKCRIENFSETLLFDQVQWSTKHVRGIDLAVQ